MRDMYAEEQQNLPVEGARRSVRYHSISYDQSGGQGLVRNGRRRKRIIRNVDFGCPQRILSGRDVNIIWRVGCVD